MPASVLPPGSEPTPTMLRAEQLDDGVDLRRKRFFRAKGVPRDLEVFAVRSNGG